jgi:sugar/nucleoside kinase (ribokinase family)
MSGERIVVVGDVINDVVVVPRGEIRPDTDTASTIRQRPGGSAGNTAAWLGSVGAPVDFVGCVGLDDLADHERVFRESGVVPYLQLGTGLPTGTIVILVDEERRTMLTERGANSALASSSVTDELLAKAGVLHISEPFLEAIDGTTIVFPNLPEGRMMSGQEEPDRIGAALRERFEVVVLTMGAEGLIVYEGKKRTKVEAPNIQHILDPTGAGDALAAGFLNRWVVDRDAVAAAQEGVFVAARAIMVIGGRPPI